MSDTNSSVPERSIYLGDSDNDLDEHVDDVSEEMEEDDEFLNEEEEGGIRYESEGSDSSSNGSPRGGSRPNSYTTSWPQSYRQSMDMYTSVTPSSIGFLGTPTLSRLSSSFITSSFQGKHTPDIIGSLIKPLLPTTAAPPPPEHQHHEVEERKSSHALLPPLPTRRHSARKLVKEDSRHSKITHEGAGAPRESTSTQAAINGINVLCGVGILSTPYAIKEGGWGGLSILFMFAVLAWYTGTLLRACLDSEPGLETYPDIGQAAFGITGRLIVSVILYLELYACCVEYIILESDNLSSLFPEAHLSFAGLYINSKVLFALMTTLIVLPTTWLRDLSLLSYLSGCGVIASILVVLCLIWVGVVDKVGFHSGGTTLNLQTFPIAVGLYGYCYSGHAVFPNIYSSLKKPSQFPTVLFACFAFCTVLFAGAAISGYAMFGDSTESQFTLNMPQHLVASKIAIWTTVVNPITKYALTLLPLALSLEELIPARHAKNHMYAIGIRSFLTVTTLLVALSIPFFGFVMSFIGSFLTMIVSLILPCICFLRISKGRVSFSQALLCSFILVVGVVSCISGTISSVSQIIQSLIG